MAGRSARQLAVAPVDSTSVAVAGDPFDFAFHTVPSGRLDKILSCLVRFDGAAGDPPLGTFVQLLAGPAGSEVPVDDPVELLLDAEFLQVLRPGVSAAGNPSWVFLIRLTGVAASADTITVNAHIEGERS